MNEYATATLALPALDRRTVAPASWRPKNTLAAFRLGARHGYRMFECDAKLSSDGVLFLLHDATLERTTNGHGAAGERSWASWRSWTRRLAFARLCRRGQRPRWTRWRLLPGQWPPPERGDQAHAPGGAGLRAAPRANCWRASGRPRPSAAARVQTRGLTGDA